jgi:hypothetical protein
VLESGFGFEFFESDGDIVHLAMDVEPEERRRHRSPSQESEQQPAAVAVLPWSLD